jgi:hypothetical protein
MTTEANLYPDAAIAIRPDIPAEQSRAWRHIASPGSWYTGAERVAIARAARGARNCRLCHARADALSPNAVAGRHDHDGVLPDVVVETVHRIVMDPGRLGRMWFDGLLAAGLTEEQYVEIVGVTAHAVSLDTFARGLGLAERPLPAPIPGTPSGYRPACATPGPGWVATVAKENASGPESDLYAEMLGANIQRALTLVPDEMRSWFALVGVQYLPQAWMRDFSREYRAISHAQIEFLAARVSALNRCIY